MIIGYVINKWPEHFPDSDLIPVIFDDIEKIEPPMLPDELFEIE